MRSAALYLLCLILFSSLRVPCRTDTHGCTCHREQFAIPQATEHYQELVRMLPAEFVGTPACLVPLVQLMCAEMSASFTTRGLTCPPWRHAKSLLSKWLPSKARPRASRDSFLKSAHTALFVVAVAEGHRSSTAWKACRGVSTSCSASRQPLYVG